MYHQRSGKCIGKTWPRRHKNISVICFCLAWEFSHFFSLSNIHRQKKNVRFFLLKVQNIFQYLSVTKTYLVYTRNSNMLLLKVFSYKMTTDTSLLDPAYFVCLLTLSFSYIFFRMNTQHQVFCNNWGFRLFPRFMICSFYFKWTIILLLEQ